MDLCVQWSDMCEQSDFLREKCPRTCETCAPGITKYIAVFLLYLYICFRHKCFVLSQAYCILLLEMFYSQFYRGLYMGSMGKFH